MPRPGHRRHRLPRQPGGAAAARPGRPACACSCGRPATAAGSTGSTSSFVEGDVTDRGSVAAARRRHGLGRATAPPWSSSDRVTRRSSSASTSRHAPRARGGRRAGGATPCTSARCRPPDPHRPTSRRRTSGGGPLPGPSVYEDTKRRAHELHARSPSRVRRCASRCRAGSTATATPAPWRTSSPPTRAEPIPIGYLPEVRQSMVNVDDCADAILRIRTTAADGDEFVVAATPPPSPSGSTSSCGPPGTAAAGLPSTKRLRSLAAPGAKVATWFGQSPTMVPETIAVATHDRRTRATSSAGSSAGQPRPLEVGMQEMVDAIKADDAARRAVGAGHARHPAGAGSSG